MDADGLMPILPLDGEGKPVPGSVPLTGSRNTSDERVLEHLQVNIRRKLPQFRGYSVQNKVRLVLACGGPSLATNMRGLRKAVERGGRLVTFNGTHDYMLDHGLTPKMHVMIDARPFNARFVQRPVEGCRYLIASQCHPSVFDALEGHDVTIFHVDINMDKENISPARKLLDDYYFGKWFLVSGGTTVTLISLVLLRGLGFKWFDMYGFDSCFLYNKHHPYDQPENGRDQPHEVVFKSGDKMRTFYCSQWMMRQAYDFEILSRKTAVDFFNCRVHGPGLIAHMIRSGAEMPAMAETKGA